MKTDKSKMRLRYALCFILILITEIIIALFVQDSFIRPYGGDILVTILICCFARIFFHEKIKFLPLWVFIFALAVEIGQYFDLVSLIGVGDIEFFQILIGTSFSFMDIICYGVGCIIFFVCEKILKNQTLKTKS